MGRGFCGVHLRTISQKALVAALLTTTAIAGGMAITTKAVAQAQATFNIPSGPLNRVLAAFGRQSGTQISYDASIASGKTSPGIQGPASREQALTRILQGSELVYSFSDARNVLITRPGSTAAGNGSVPAGGSVLPGAIDVSGGADRNASSGSGYQGTPDWVYQAPAAVSVISREAIESNPSRNARDLLDNVAGVYANRSEAQNPGIAVNIRGLQDNDRIVTMIDGARQSFQRGGHGTTQRAYVDTAFVRAVDIEKSSTSGVGSLGSLGGSVNFRTIIADDLIRPGEKFGGEINAATGTNGFKFDGSVSAAARISDSFSILAGISYKDIGPYDVGRNGNLTNLAATSTGNTLLFSGQNVVSGIVKAEAKLTDDMKLTLGWIRNKSKFSTGGFNQLLGGVLQQSREEVLNDTLTAAFDWKPGTDLIDLKAKLYYNHIKNDDWGLVVDGQPRNFKMATLGGSIENTSRFDTNLGRLSFNYGAEAFRDDANSTVRPYVVDGVDMAPFWNGGTPGGKRDVVGGFASAKLEHDDWLTISGGLRYDWYHTKGSTTIYGGNTFIEHEGVCRLTFPDSDVCRVWSVRPWTEVIPPQPHDVHIDRSEGAFLPTFTIAVKPFDWLQPFVKYSKSFRPPTVMESFLASGHSTDGINTWSPNPYLKPERGDTWEVGANISQNALFKTNDSLRLKVVGFYREIKDYIALGHIYNDQTNWQYSSPINIDGITRMKGVEVEANYDARSWYVGGTLTLNKSDWAKGYEYRGLPNVIGPETAIIFVQPEMRYAIDAGVRLFDEKLTIGGKMTHVGEAKPTIGTLQQNYQLPAYTIYDLYASYAFDEKTKLRINVTNLTDVAYISALGADYYAMPGRTATVSLNYKF